MAKTAAILAVHLLTGGAPVRVGVLTRDRDGAVSFVVDEGYLRDPNRPILSLSLVAVNDEVRTRERLSARSDKIGLNGYLPPWFAGVLPEGALRDLVTAEMGAGDHDQFDLLTRLGADLPGAVLVTPESAPPASAGPLRLERVAGFEAARAQGLVKFSLAGVQLKFSASAVGERFTAPASAGEGRVILKVSSRQYPGLPEAEHAAMTLSRLIGVETAPCRLVATDRIEGVPSALLDAGPTALMVERFDRRPDGGRLHMEDAGQILGAVGERKYTMANTETVLHMIHRFSSDPRADVLQGMRRVVADVLIGNGDNHLKNWTFVFPDNRPRLSPAYDIVPTVLYHPRDTLALEFAGARRFEAVTYARFGRVARYLGLDPAWIEREMRAVVRQALTLWPAAISDLLDDDRAKRLIDRLKTLRLVEDLS